MSEEISLNSPLAVLGEEDIVSGFRALGFQVYVAGKPRAFQNVLGEILKNKIAICLVQDDIYLSSQEEIDKYKHAPLPIFIPFSKTGKTDLIDDLARKIRLKATGVF